MYQPVRQIINGGFGNIRFTGPDSPSTEGIADSYLAAQERKYKETKDYYDLQREEMDNLSSVLNGTYGADFSYLNKLLVQARNDMKQVFKGTSPKEYRSAAVQDKLFEIKNRILRAKNTSETSLKQITDAYTKSKGTPSIKEGELKRYLEAQLQLPPDQRDPDIANKVFTDPLFFNSYDYLTGVLDKRKTSTENIQTKDDNFFYSYEATYRPDLGYFDKDGNWTFDPKDDVIDEALSNTQFYNSVVGLLPPDEAKKLTDDGNTNELKKAVHQMARQHLHDVFVREEGGETISPYGPKLVQKGRTLNPAKYARPTVAEKKENEFANEVLAIQQRLRDSNPLAFAEYISPDGWRNFDFQYDEDGNVDAIIGTMVDKNNIMYGKTMGNPPTREEIIPVNVNDPGSVRQALSRVKFVYSKDKTKVSADPLKKTEAKEKPKIQGF